MSTPHSKGKKMKKVRLAAVAVLTMSTAANAYGDDRLCVFSSELADSTYRVIKFSSGNGFRVEQNDLNNFKKYLKAAYKDCTGNTHYQKDRVRQLRVMESDVSGI